VFPRCPPVPGTAQAGGPHHLHIMTSYPVNPSAGPPWPTHSRSEGGVCAGSQPAPPERELWNTGPAPCRCRSVAGWGHLLFSLALSGGLLEAFAQTITNSHPTTNAVTLPTVVVTGQALPPGGDVIAPNSVVTAEELKLKLQSSLGDTLGWQPGVSSTAYGPGSSRPVIRGFTGNRVRMLHNGLGTGDISFTSPDHGVAIEPLFIRRIEVLRGPATILHGGPAIGGAVDVETKNIPIAPPQRTVEGEVETRFASVSDEKVGAIAATAGGGPVAFQVNALKRAANDYHFPGLARNNPTPGQSNPSGRLPETWVETDTYSAGAGWFWPQGRAGLAVSTYESAYGVPFHSDAHQHLIGGVVQANPPVSIALRQNRFDFEGELFSPVAALESVKYRAAYSEYRHAEREGALTATSFANNEFETRLEARHAPLGALSGRFGAHFNDTSFKSAGLEVNTPPTLAQNWAVFLLEDLQLGPVRLQIGGRWGEQDILAIGRTRNVATNYTTKSFSLGAAWEPFDGYEVALVGGVHQRAPTTQELFANGPHVATGTYEIGGFYTIPGFPFGGGLGLERSMTYEAIFRKTQGRFTGELTFFRYDFDNYIFLESLGPGWELNGLPIFRHVQRPARFHGLEVEAGWDLLVREREKLRLTGLLDWIHAQDLERAQPLPRIPPIRLGMRLEYEWRGWTAGVEGRHVTAQDRIQKDRELPTPAYTFLNADLRYRFDWKHRAASFFVQGTNLLDEQARSHVSVIKEVAPLPGLNLALGMNLKF